MTLTNSRVLVTGANGFIGRNLVVRLNELSNISVNKFVRGDDLANLQNLIAQCDAVIHLAGENRPVDEAAFFTVNTGLTEELCNAVHREYVTRGRHVPVVLASSTQAERDNAYGRSKLAAEELVQALAETTNNPCAIIRLPGVFGKWCKPNYNSVVATFCHKIARDIQIEINDPTHNLQLVYIDDVVNTLLALIEKPAPGFVRVAVQPEYAITLGELASQLRAFGNCRSILMSERVGTGLVRALYATYVSHLPDNRFSYEIPKHGDHRGIFVEMLKTSDSGQFSFFTAHPGITRGGHYHHTKSEKFLVIKGEALFSFKHILTNQLVQLRTTGAKPEVVDTIPGWSHDITNVGDDEMVVMLWANENFDPQRPDTVASKI
jgi:UDP-2-acetamido-2,6-beta-L-arabino-hexul-4-ose reductase